MFAVLTVGHDGAVAVWTRGTLAECRSRAATLPGSGLHLWAIVGEGVLGGRTSR